MPIYEYRCKSCGQHLEIIQKVGDPARRKCERCGGRLEKLISRTAFVLKGGGWYSEGYASGGGKKSGEPDKDKKDTKKKEAASTGPSETRSAPAGGSGSGGGKQGASAS